MIAASAWALLVVAAVAWGDRRVAGTGAGLGAAPLKGRWAPHLELAILPAAVVGATVAARGPGVAARAPWRWVPVLTGAGALAWTAALAGTDGWSRLTEPLTTRHEYEPFAARVGGLMPFLESYVTRLDGYPVHVQGHPPGPVVVAWSLDHVGLGGAGWLALVALAAWGVAGAAAVVAARAVAGDAAARRAAPALVLLPAAVWAGTSLDALFAGLAAAGVALLAVAGARGSAAWAAAGGAALGAGLLSSYGTVAMLVVALAALVAASARRGDPRTARPTEAAAPCDRPDRRRRPVAGLVAAAALAGAAMLALAGAAGFWWPAGLAATRHAYWAGIAAHRPGPYLTLLGNPAALALASGPATAAGVARVASRRRRAPRAGNAWVLPAAALATVLAANLSQLSRGEVERIWLPFVPWLALAAPGDRRGWLAAQAGVGLVLQSVLISPW